MNVDAGQKVKKGTVIAAVDPLDYNLQFEANKAAYVTSKLQMERNKKLLAMQAISKQDYEIAEANYVKSQIGLRDFAEYIGRYKIESTVRRFCRTEIC